jgi:hypothetical protein
VKINKFQQNKIFDRLQFLLKRQMHFSAKEFLKIWFSCKKTGGRNLTEIAGSFLQMTEREKK